MNKPGRYYPLGYLVVLLPPALLVLGVANGVPSLLFFVLFCVGPLTRAWLGNIPEEPGEWSERMTTTLDRLPAVAAVTSMAAVGYTLVLLAARPVGGAGDWLAFGLSMWTCMLCAIPVAHELIHRRGAQRTLGNLLAGMAGYPELEGEHIRHHAASGTVERPEWPRLDESVWSFALRRTPYVVASAWQYQAMLRGVRSGRRYPFVVSLIATLLTFIGFTIAAGAAGGVLYLCVVAGIHFAVQAINYIQHWGLGNDNVPDADEGRYGWECRCLLQGWMFLNIALHHNHHQNSSTPYYRLVPSKGSARLPGSYIPLLFLSLVPSLWNRLMRPAVATWKLDPTLQREPRGARIVCLPVVNRYSDVGSDMDRT